MQVDHHTQKAKLYGRRGLVRDDCLTLLAFVARNQLDPDNRLEPQSYERLALATGIPRRSLWDLLNTYKDILRDVAYQYNYRLKIINSEDLIIDVVYDGPTRQYP